MQAILKGQELTSSRMECRQQRGSLICLAAAATEETPAKIAWQYLEELPNLDAESIEHNIELDRSQ